MDTFTLYQGTALPIDATLRDDLGDPITTYSGSEALTAAAWPGGDRAAAFAPSVAWTSAPDGAFRVTITAAQGAGLALGRWFATVTLEDPLEGPLEAYRFAFDVWPRPGSATAPPAYCSFADLLTDGRSWLRQLQSEDDETGFGRQRGRAREWLDALIIARWPGSSGGSFGGSDITTGFDLSTGQAGPGGYMARRLAAGGLIVGAAVAECCAKKAIGYICEGQLGPAAGSDKFAALGRHYHREADNLARSLVVGVDPGPSGVPSIVVNLGTITTR